MRWFALVKKSSGFGNSDRPADDQGGTSKLRILLDVSDKRPIPIQEDIELYCIVMCAIRGEICHVAGIATAHLRANRW